MLGFPELDLLRFLSEGPVLEYGTLNDWKFEKSHLCDCRLNSIKTKDSSSRSGTA